jgi:hypothetical protein
MLKKKQLLLVSAIAFTLLVSAVAPIYAVDYLRASDFGKESWSKTIDYLEYVDFYAASHGLPRPPAGAHAYLYMTYVNYLGVQMLYAGLSNITMALGQLTVTIPVQTFMMHYKTENQSRDVVTASSHIMLLAYNETANTTRYTDVPDRNDTLYASFNLGFDLSSLINTADRPGLNSKTTIIPLTHSDTKLSWHWGMKYTNLTAIWWRVYLDPDNSSYVTVPVAVTVYEELTFTYDLIFDPDNNTATITSNYVIGRMTDLWVVDTWLWFIPVIVHYNSTGCYYLNEDKYSDETIYEFLHKHNISMSIVLFQASAILDHTTESSADGQDVVNSEVDVSNDTVSTFAEDGEKIFDANFGTKNTYDLYNSTSGVTTTYDAYTRTVNRDGFANNPIFHIHTFLMRYIPLALAHMDRPLFDQARNHLLNMTYADYFYVISYPVYDGYRVKHDPTYVAYFAAAADSGVNPLAKFFGFIVLAAIVCVVVVAAVLVLKRRSKNAGPT